MMFKANQQDKQDHRSTVKLFEKYLRVVKMFEKHSRNAGLQKFKQHNFFLTRNNKVVGFEQDTYRGNKWKIHEKIECSTRNIISIMGQGD